MEPVDVRQKPWRQLAFALGEAALALVSGGVQYVVISRVSGPGLLGVYALALAWLTLFQGVSSFGIPEFVLRETGARGRDAGVQVAHALLLGLFSSVAAICAMLATVKVLGYPAAVARPISVASLALIPAFLNTACRSVFVARREMHVPLLAALVEMTITTSVSLLLVLSGHGAVALMIAVVGAKIASASVVVTMLFRRVLTSPPPFDYGALKQTARSVFAFGVGAGIGMLSKRVNVIMVSLWANIETVGHFAAATKTMEFCLIVPELFAQFLLTRMAHSFIVRDDRDPNRFGAWFEVLFALVLPLCIGVWVFAKPILETLFGAPFGDSLWILRVLMIYVLTETLDVVMSAILKSAHRQRQDAAFVALNLATNVALNLVLLPVFGAIGAALGRICGGAASATARHLLIRRVLTGVDWIRFARKQAAISIGAGSICYLLLSAQRPAWLMLLYVALVGGLLILSSSFSFSTIKEIMSSPSGAD